MLTREERAEARDYYDDSQFAPDCRCGWKDSYDEHTKCEGCGRDLCIDRSRLEWREGLCARCFPPEERDMFAVIGALVEALRAVRTEVRLGRAISDERIEQSLAAARRYEKGADDIRQLHEKEKERNATH